MRTIHDHSAKGNLGNEVSGTSGANGEPRHTEEAASIRQKIEPSGGCDSANDAIDRTGDPLQRRSETEGANSEESASPSARRGLTALASLREYFDQRGMDSEIAGQLTTLEHSIRHPPANDDNDDDDEPPTNRTTPSDEPPPPLSRFALRDDGAWLVSLQDAADRDLSDREVISFLVLSDAEIMASRSSMDQVLCEAAASVIGRLPKKPG